MSPLARPIISQPKDPLYLNLQGLCNPIIPYLISLLISLITVQVVSIEGKLRFMYAKG